MEREVKTFACDYAINADGLQIGEDQPGILLGMR